ncbi:hypothetical protein GOP47_0003470 [Adiantum capillus-veneris]|uniref:Uncharacterized protein n=1 Tax=Adiantum capillus-veneris TaxID=13818 RepID=A0A9D4VE24_ADICA|nr:hypothetical protein GOP47_0003470 [Adiantum capillus-veneris]
MPELDPKLALHSADHAYVKNSPGQEKLEQVGNGAPFLRKRNLKAAFSASVQIFKWKEKLSSTFEKWLEIATAVTERILSVRVSTNNEVGGKESMSEFVLFVCGVVETSELQWSACAYLHKLTSPYHSKSA